MQQRFQLFIDLDKQFYKHSDLISGKVNLKTVEPLNLEKINLKLVNTYSASFINQTLPELVESKTFKNNFEIFKSVSEFTKISSGHHTFPFKFYLKNNDNATVEMKQNFNSCSVSIINKYNLEADIKLFGIYMPIINTVKELFIVDSNNDLPETKLIVEITSCFCLFNSNFELLCDLNKKIYYAGDKIKAMINSKKKIVSVNIYLYQIVSLYIQNSFKTMSRLVSQGKSEKNDVECIIPTENVSTASHELFDIKYILQFVVSFERSNSIRYKKDVFIIKKNDLINEEYQLDVLQGIEAAPQFFTLYK